MKPFYLNTLLTTLGLRLGRSYAAPSIRAVNAFMLTIVIITLTVGSFNSIYAIVAIECRHVAKANLFFRLSALSVIFHSTLWQSDKMYDFILKVRKMSTNKRGELWFRRCDQLVTMVLVVHWLVMNVIMVMNSIHGGRYASLLLSGTDITALRLSSTLSMIMGILGYHSVIFMYSACSGLFLIVFIDVILAVKRTIALVETEPRIVEIDKLRMVYNDVNSLVQEFSAIFGPFPLAQISYVFLSVSLRFTDLIIHEDEYTAIHGAEILFYETISGLVISMVIIFLASHLQKCMEQLRETVLVSISQTPCDQLGDHLCKWSFMVDLVLKPIPSVSACGTFTLDRRFALKFIGALVPFTVMAVTTMVQIQRGKTLI